MATASRTSERRATQRLNAATLAARGDHYHAKRLLDCVAAEERKEVTGYKTYRCQQRYCFYCGPKYLQGFIDIYERRLSQLAANGHRLSLLTLTTPNVPCLKPGLYKWLFDRSKKLRRRNLFSNRVDGAVSVIETDFNHDSQGYHVHMHGILSYRQCIPQQEIREVWSKLTAIPPDGFPIEDTTDRVVWIEKIDQETIQDAVGYIFKFKPIDDPEAFAEYVCAVAGLRLIRSYGTMHARGRRV